MPWNVMCQTREGKNIHTGEERESLYQAKQTAKELAWEMQGTTFYVQRGNRVPAVYRYERTAIRVVQ